MKITDAELVILLAHEQGCTYYFGEGDALCALELDDPPKSCECLRVVRVLRDAIENLLGATVIDDKLAEAEAKST